MQWVVGFTILVALVVNLPLLYSLNTVHGLRGVADLWGYSPHQFLFCLLILPFAAFGTFTSVYVTVVHVGPKLQPEFGGRVFVENWMAVLLGGIALSSLITAADYFGSGRSLDKLQSPYATVAIRALRNLNAKVDALKRSEREDARDKLIRDGKAARQSLSLPATRDVNSVNRWMGTLPFESVLQVVIDPELQRQLRLTNDALYALSLVQVLTSIFVGVCALFSAGLYVHVARGAPQLHGSAEMHYFFSAAFYVIFFIGLYPICYQQYRSELEVFTGPASTTLQQYFVGGLVLLVLSTLLALNPTKDAIPGIIFARLLPIMVIVLGLGAEMRGPQVLRRLVGTRTNAGTQ